MSNTNFSAFTVKELPLIRRLKHKRANLFFILATLTTIFISACSSQPPAKKASTATKTVTQKVDDIKQPLTAENQLALAQSLNKQSTEAGQQQVNELLVAASELFLQEKNFVKALWLANKVSDLVHNKQSIYRLLLVKAASLQALNYTKQAYQQLQLVEELVKKTTNSQSNSAKLILNFAYYQTLSAVLLSSAKLPDASVALLFAFSMNEQASEQDILSLWHQLSSLSSWQLKQVAKTNPPLFTGWQELLHYSRQAGDNPAQFSRYLSRWQQIFPTHPARLIVEKLATDEFTLTSIENIAVLLPLSGNQASAGLAAQQGILAAYKNDAEININFIDTQQLDWNSLATQFSNLQIDHVIGPLLKSSVYNYLTMSADSIELQIPTLLLNLPQQHTLTSGQSALSMRPESEAQQAAAVLSQQDYNSPIILSHQDKVSKRVAIAFSQQWYLSTGKEVDIVYFNQGKQMQASLKESLDVNTSQTRIKKLTSRLKHNIKSEARNRRDIDMIYLVGSAAQTRLIKPYIDVNISPFAKVIPVFASSRSHSHFNDINIKSSKSDLQNLTFTQMPWLLKSTQRNKPLAQLSQQLWPKRSDSLSRIFAMGFDSYNLLTKIPLMQQAPYIRHYGQTGTLKLDKHNILTRSLIWGRYQNDKVTEVVME